MIFISAMMKIHRNIGVVIIGRNEGDRLKICLESVVKQSKYILYVDSSSTDNSIYIAGSLNVNVVNLDVSKPFTAARARNEGYKKLIELYPELLFVQFIDGDCELGISWFDAAEKHLVQHDDVSVVCGRLRERYPYDSVYNMLCDIEWNTPVGETNSCGGIALIRRSAFDDVSGFNPNVVAGEEPELCLRMRLKGWKIWRINEEMALHDANIKAFSQWWKRNVRSGLAYALGANMHGAKAEQHWVREVRRTRFWALYIPILIVIMIFINPVFIFGFTIYPLQVLRLAIKNKNRIKANWIYAFFVTLGKFPEMQGQIKFYLKQLFKTPIKIIEYK